MEDWYFYIILLMMGVLYYIIVRLVLPRAIGDEVEFIRQCEIEQIENDLDQEIAYLRQEIDVRINTIKHEEIEQLKQVLVKEFQQYKQQLELESKKSVVMYEQQFSSFKVLTKALQKSIQAIERRTDSKEQLLFGYCSQSDCQSFEESITGELIYVNDSGRRWLHIFLEILRETAKDDDVYEVEDRGMDIYVGIRYKQLKFIQEHLINYFCGEIGVADFQDATEDIEILNACRLLSMYYNRDWLSQLNEKFRSTKEKSPQTLVSDAKGQLLELIQTLEKFKTYLLDEDRRFWYEKQFEIEQSLHRIEELQKIHENPYEKLPF